MRTLCYCLKTCKKTKNATNHLIPVAILIFTILIFPTSAHSQTKNDRLLLGKSAAEQELKSSLTDKSIHNVVNNKTIIIKDTTTALKIAEPLLFQLYGKKHIIKQRPYEIYVIDDYWFIKGTLPKNYRGGTFLIIIDSHDCKVIRITHGK